MTKACATCMGAADFLLVLEGKRAEKIPQGHEGGRPPSEQAPVSRRASPVLWGCSLCSFIFHAGPSRGEHRGVRSLVPSPVRAQLCSWWFWSFLSLPVPFPCAWRGRGHAVPCALVASCMLLALPTPGFWGPLCVTAPGLPSVNILVASPSPSPGRSSEEPLGSPAALGWRRSPEALRTRCSRCPPGDVLGKTPSPAPPSPAEPWAGVCWVLGPPAGCASPAPWWVSVRSRWRGSGPVCSCQS